MKKVMSHEESLQLITKMINSSKDNLKNNSVFFLLWGWLVLSASIIHFVLIQIPYRYAWLPWPVMMVAGAIASVVIGIRIGKKTKVITYFDKMLIYLWYGFFVIVLIIVVLGNLGKLNWQEIQGIIMLLYGLGTFVSGGVLKFKPLIIGGILSWILAIAAFFVAYQYVLLLVAVSIIIAYLVPGYMLRKIEK